MKFSEKAKNMLRKALVPTLVVTLIYFVMYLFFGPSNTMIAPFATLSFLRYQSMCNHYECMLKNFAVFLVMAVLSAVAVISLPLCILVNGAALFWIAYLLIDEYNPTNYFPAGMALIFFQIAPVHTLPELTNRIAALFVTFLIIFLFVFFLSRLEAKPDRLPALIREGFDNCRQQLAACDANDTQRLDALHHALCEINRQCSGEIYSYNRASIRMKGKTNWYCRFVLIFQVINYLTLNRKQKENRQKAASLYQTFRHLFEHCKPSPDYRRLNFRVRKPDLRNFRLRFALRQIITLTPCLAFAFTGYLDNAYWLVISVFFMMIPFSENTLKRVQQRVTGTIVGILLCLFLFSVFDGFAARTVIMTIANFFIYGVNGYGATVVYITCSALAMQTIGMDAAPLLMLRLFYTILGAAIALFANKYIFPIRIGRQISYLTELLSDIRSRLADLAQNSDPQKEACRREIDQQIIKSYLLSKRLETLHDSLPESEQGFDYPEFEKAHMLFLAEYLSKYLL